MILSSAQYKKLKLTGINKVQILVIVHGAQESNYNLRRLIEMAKLNELKLYVAADIKLINCMLDLSVS